MTGMILFAGFVGAYIGAAGVVILWATTEKRAHKHEEDGWCD